MPIAGSIAGIVSAGASVAGTISAAGSQKNAAKAAQAQQDRVNTDAQPFLQAGKDALSRISNPNTLLSNFTTSPGYQFRLQQGLDSVGQSKAVNGLLRSGGAVKALNDYASGTASNEFGNWWNQQMGLVQTGQSGLATEGGVADNKSNIALNNGAQQGNAAIGLGNNIGNLAGSLATLFNKAPATTNTSSYGTGGGSSEVPY